ncbi:MAG: DUF1013 domain-containing protein, partial [Alphaproteobacteria bacterium]|nr:DUF1013 domain-containing protein [Alphaproteobacteria bacterium]
VQAIADGEVAAGILGLNPLMNGQLTQEEITRCEKDPRAHLKMVRTELPQPTARSKGPRYTPVSKRADKPDAILYLIKTHPELQDAQIARLLATTKDTIVKVRDKLHWNASNLKPRNPVLLGLCKQMDLDAALQKAQRRIAREQKGLPANDLEDSETPTSPFKDFDAPEETTPNESFVTFGSSEEQPDIDHDKLAVNLEEID